GEHKFRDIIPLYINGTKGILLVFDGTSMSTLEELHNWIEIIKNYIDFTNIPMLLISTKQDLNPKINMNAITSFKNKYSIKEYYQTSAKSGENINMVFHKISHLVIKGPENSSITNSSHIGSQINVKC
ncbi:MAG: ADP-ribosylation factor-like protein, partial [Candidatus Hodarchaeales archaeon]